MSDVRIYVMAHKAFDEPRNPIYVPMQVGAALHDSLGYLADNTGDNISSKNPHYSELTGLYWMWKNGPKCDITGLCHYRRFFLKNGKDLLDVSDFEQILQYYDVITTEEGFYPGGESIYAGYGYKHYTKDLDLTREAIEKHYPDYLQVYDEVMQGNGMYFANMMVTTQERMNAYAQWLFTILFEVEKHLDMTGYDDYNRRVYGFISERLLKVWICKNQYKVFECYVGVTESKVETKEAISKSADMLKMGNYEAVLQYLNDVRKKRPDAFYEESDVDRKLADIYTFAEIMAIENRAGMDNLRKLSLDYLELRNVFQQFQNVILEKPEGIYDFVENHKLSVQYVLVMLPKILEEKESLIQIYNILATAYLDHGDLNMARIYVNQALREG